MSAESLAHGPLAIDPLLRVIQAIETDESLNGRLTGAAEAQQRSRLILVIMGIACAAMIVATYNAYLSFDAEFALESVVSEPAKLASTPASKPLETRTFGDRHGPTVLTAQNLRTWADNRYVSISLLGIKVSVDDAVVIGTVTLVVVAIWQLLALRREHQSITYLLRDTRRNGNAASIDLLRRQWRVLHGIVSESVFTTVGKSLAPSSGLREHHDVGAGRMSDLGKAAAGVTHFMWKNRTVLQRVVLTIIVQFVLWLPVLTSVFMFVLDRRSYYQRSAFRDGVVSPPTAGAGESFLMASMCWFVVWFAPLLFVTTLSVVYNHCTEAMIREYHTELLQSLAGLFTREEIEPLAYRKWQEAGSPVCDGVAFWRAAENELLHGGHR